MCIFIIFDQNELYISETAYNKFQDKCAILIFNFHPSVNEAFLKINVWQFTECLQI